jgi:hypothetical protein
MVSVSAWRSPGRIRGVCATSGRSDHRARLRGPFSSATCHRFDGNAGGRWKERSERILIECRRGAHPVRTSSNPSPGTSPPAGPSAGRTSGRTPGSPNQALAGGALLASARCLVEVADERRRHGCGLGRAPHRGRGGGLRCCAPPRWFAPRPYRGSPKPLVHRDGDEINDRVRIVL